ncbi:MAG: hypothetical protein WBF06_03580 [Candidatus Acidiferrales bacterium]
MRERAALCNVQRTAVVRRFADCARRKDSASNHDVTHPIRAHRRFSRIARRAVLRLRRPDCLEFVEAGARHANDSALSIICGEPRQEHNADATASALIASNRRRKQRLNQD